MNATKTYEKEKERFYKNGIKPFLWKNTEKKQRIHNSMPINQVHPLVLCSRFLFLQKRRIKHNKIPVRIRWTYMHGDHDGRQYTLYIDSFSNRALQKKWNLTYNWAIAKAKEHNLFISRIIQECICNTSTTQKKPYEIIAGAQQSTSH